MIHRLKPLSIGLALLAGTGSVFAVSADQQQAQISAELTSVNQEMTALQKQVKNLQGQVVTLKQKLHQQQRQPQQTRLPARMKPNSSGESGAIGTSKKPIPGTEPIPADGEHTLPQTYLDLQSRVGIAPFTGIPTYYDGEELIVNAPSINEDAKLLRRRANHIAALKQLNEPVPPNPRIVFSGALVGIGQYSKPYVGGYNSNIDLTQAELDSFVEISSWVQGLMTINYDNAPNNNTSANRVDNSRFYMDKGFLTIGNFSRSPFYGSLGQMYVPFGRYSSAMISSPLTEFIGQIRTRAISVGFRPDGTTPYASTFVFNGASNTNNRINNAGVDLGYKFKFGQFNGDVGASAIGNIGDALGFQGTSSSEAFDGFAHTSEDLAHPVAGVDIHSVLGYSAFTWVTEYVTATRQFAVQNLSFDNQGAKPSALNTELTYAFHLFAKPSTFNIGYGMTKQALALALPRARYDASFEMAILRHTIATLEYRHDINYSTGHVATGQELNAVDPIQLGRSSNTITAQLGIYF